MTNYCIFLCVKTLSCQIKRPELFKTFYRRASDIPFIYNKSSVWSKYRTFKYLNCPPLLIQTRLAGHSKWQNIRHIKAAKDQQKSKIASRISNQVKKAVIEGGANPKYNNKLQDLMDQAKENNIPKATLEKVIKRAQNAKISTALIEILGPGESYFIIEVETVNLSETIRDVRVVCKKYGAVTVPEGRAKSHFEIKGVITVSETKDNSPLDHATAIDLAIEAGAEDVQESTDENEIKILKFFCDANDFYQVKKHIESSNYVIDDAKMEYIPRIRITLTDELLETAEKLYNMLEELPDVINIYDNIE